MIREGDKVRLKTGEPAIIDEVLEEGRVYIGGIYTKDGLTVDHIEHENIVSVFEEIERPL